MNFEKFAERFAKHKIKNFAKILQPLLHNLPSATHPPLLYARRFFNAAWQCYFEMKTNKEPYFSILSSIILWCFHILLCAQYFMLTKSTLKIGCPKPKTFCCTTSEKRTRTIRLESINTAYIFAVRFAFRFKRKSKNFRAKEGKNAGYLIRLSGWK